ncbi:hypothetical protein [Streptomyces sp. NPDC007856]|uniref:hypothetical protein n=1 Tax=Streptomyces sp. NPDC007856 TaxID=3364781 RepID=UPI00369B5FD1
MPRLNEGVTGLIRQAPDELPEALEAVGDLNPAQRRKIVVDQFPPDAVASGCETVHLRPATTEPKPAAASTDKQGAVAAKELQPSPAAPASAGVALQMWGTLPAPLPGD